MPPDWISYAKAAGECPKDSYNCPQWKSSIKPVAPAVVDGDVADVAVVLQLLVEQELQSATYKPPPTPLWSSPLGSVVSWIGYEVATFLFLAIYTIGMGSPNWFWSA